MDNNNDAFDSLGLEGVSLHNNLNTPTASVEEKPTTEPEPAAPAVTEPALTEPETKPEATPQIDNNDDTLNDLSDEETIDLFVEGIMEEKGVNAPTEEIRQDLKNDLKNQLLQEIDRSLIAELPDDKLEELNRIVVANGQVDPEVIAKMIQDANLDVTDIVGTTMVRFREIYLGQNKTVSAEQNQPTEG